jgi:hypothetical protein
MSKSKTRKPRERSKAAARRRVQPLVSCRWRENQDGYWNTKCGEAFEFLWDGPKKNGFRFCPYCGHTITESGS